MVRLIFLFVFAVLLPGLSRIIAGEPLYVRGGTIITMAGAPIENGILRIEEGKITYVGRRLSIPTTAAVIDAQDKYITPGFILANTSLGLPRDSLHNPGDLSPITPGYHYLDIVDFNDPAFDEVKMHGITTVNIMPQDNRPMAGAGVLMKTGGLTLKSRVVKEASTLSLFLIQETRGMLTERERSLASEVEKIVLIRNVFREAQELKRSRENIDMSVADYNLDGHILMLIRVLNQEIPVMLYAATPTEIERAISLIEDFEFRTIFVNLRDLSQVWDRIEDMKIDVITGPITHLENNTWMPSVEMSLVHTLLSHEFRVQILPAGYYQSGVRGFGNYIHQAMKLQATGITDERVLATMTVYPARMLGVEDQLGTIELGKDADLNIFSEHPAKVLALPDIVMIDGRVVNEHRR